METELLKQIMPYLKHLPTCNLNQDWTEAEQAMADTPERFRNEGWHQAYEEMRQKMNTCSCGLASLKSRISEEPDGAEEINNIPAQCKECGYQNSENCNTCPVINPQWEPV